MNKQQPVHWVNGVLVPEPVDLDWLDRLKHFQLYSDDVWIATYPKCGTTWTQQIVRLLHNGGEVRDGKILSEASPWLEGVKQYPQVDIDRLPRPRSFKTHYRYDLLPCGPPHATPCKYIYVLRNPKDVAVSCYFYYKTLFDMNLDWDTFCKDFIDGNVIYGSFFDHVRSWWPHRNDERILFLRYEDMKKDLRQAVLQIASFLELNVPDDTIAKIVDFTCFEKMKNDPSANFSWCELHDREGATKFLRKGEVGDWKNYLTAEQSVQIDSLCADIDVEFEYD